MIYNFSLHFLFKDAMFGLLGGFISLLVREKGCIRLPRIKNGYLYFNSFNGLILGALSGMIGNQTPMNALMWGIGGATILHTIVESVDKNLKNNKNIGEDKK